MRAPPDRGEGIGALAHRDIRRARRVCQERPAESDVALVRPVLENRGVPRKAVRRLADRDVDRWTDRWRRHLIDLRDVDGDRYSIAVVVDHDREDVDTRIIDIA